MNLNGYVDVVVNEAGLLEVIKDPIWLTNSYEGIHDTDIELAEQLEAQMPVQYRDSRVLVAFTYTPTCPIGFALGMGMAGEVQAVNYMVTVPVYKQSSRQNLYEKLEVILRGDVSAGWAMRLNEQYINATEDLKLRHAGRLNGADITHLEFIVSTYDAITHWEAFYGDKFGEYTLLKKGFEMV